MKRKVKDLLQIGRIARRPRFSVGPRTSNVVKSAEVIDVKSGLHVDVRYEDGSNEGFFPKEAKHAQAIASSLHSSKGKTRAEALNARIDV